MTLAFMGLVSAMISERVSVPAGFYLLPRIAFDRCWQRGSVVVQRSARRRRLAVLRGGASVRGADFAGFAFVAAEVHA